MLSIGQLSIFFTKVVKIYLQITYMDRFLKNYIIG